MEQQTKPASEKHSVPIIDRMMEILGELERNADGVTISDLTQQIGQPRTTVYRIMKTLQRHDVVRREDDGSYKLGARLLRLAAHAAAGASEIDLPRVLQPVLDRLADELGESVKLSVVDSDGLLVIAVAQSRREYALTVVAGQRIPFHVSAAGKLLLAHMGEADREAVLAAPLPALTANTVTDPKRLARQLATIRRNGWSRDQSEQSPSIHAIAAPVVDRAGNVLAAISVPYLAGLTDERIAEIRDTTVAAAAAGSDAIAAASTS